MKAILIGVSFLASVGVAHAASPAVSRGEVLLEVSFDECMQRARSSFLDEGFSIVPSEAKHTNFVLARKDIHTAYITCSPAPDSKMWGNVFVASFEQDRKIPGAVREKLQERMESQKKRYR
jgi:hypothetical protein